MKILLIGEKYSTNLGDGVIFQTVRTIIEGEFPESVIYELDLSGRVSYSDETDKLLSIPQKIIKKVSADHARASLVKRQLINIAKHEAPQLVLFVGGQLFMDYFSLTIETIVNEAKKRNMSVIFNACGIGPNNEAYQKRLHRALSQDCVKAISIRDGEGAFKKLYPMARNPDITMDPVMELGKYYPLESMGSSGKKRRIGINIMSPWIFNRNDPDTGHRHTKLIVEQVLKFCDKYSIEWEIYCNGAIDDREYIESMCGELKIDSSKLANTPETPEALVELIRGYDFIVGFRMHTHIIANSLGIPTIGFIWDRKLSEYANHTNQEGLFLDINDKTIKNLSKNLKHLVSSDRVVIRELGTKASSEFLRDIINTLT